MRVIAGKYRGRRLRTVEGLQVRPTSDRLRETLFNILKPYIAGKSFLDICAGSGAVGIEALSRGASQVAFIERSRRACSAIRANLDAIGAAEDSEIVGLDALSALRQLSEDRRRFDVVFFDPPYASLIYDQVLRWLGRGELISTGGVAVVEHETKHPPRPEYGKLRMFRTVRQGESSLSFYALS